tara:strand:+ start:955 stop:1143 length:189 start_codon:yes stop_codon:yes gene_type:complete
MTNLKDKLNSHLPIILQLLSTLSLIVIAMSAICGSKSLKELAGSHQIDQRDTSTIHKGLHDH